MIIPVTPVVWTEARTWSCPPPRGVRSRHVHQRRPHRPSVGEAVEPPGQARTDLEIFLDFARRMDLRDKDGGPLVTWHDPESAFDAWKWKKCSAGRPCDYTGINYDLLRGPSGIQWPCHDEAPSGTERLYTDGRFWASPDVCESYGLDLLTGTPVEPIDYRSLNPDGKAVIKPGVSPGSTTQHRRSGWRSPPKTPAPTAWPKATWRRSRHPAARCTPAPGSPRPGGQRTHPHRMGSRLQTAHLQDRRGPDHPNQAAMSIGLVLRRLHHDESRLVHRLERLSEQHHAEHEIHCLARDLATWSEVHLARITEMAPTYDVETGHRRARRRRQAAF